MNETRWMSMQNICDWCFFYIYFDLIHVILYVTYLSRLGLNSCIRSENV